MLKDLIKKAQEENLDYRNIEKELLEYIVDSETTDEDVAQALIEIEKRGTNMIATKFNENFKIEISCYTRKIKSIKIRIFSRYNYQCHYNIIGTFIYDFANKTFFVKPYNESDYGGYGDTTCENLLEMRKICKLISKDTIKNMIATKLSELL